MNILISGGCGFLGSNLSRHGILNHHIITVFDNLSRTGSSKNLQYLQSLGNFNFIHGDTRNQNDVNHLICNNKFDAIFHVAGQVAMTTSVENPYKDFEINTKGTLNILEAVRRFSPQTSVFFSSSNKVYGDLEQFTYTENDTRYICNEHPRGFDESTSLDFRSPYGCSKGAADQYMLEYYKTYGIKTVVFRHSSMYGSRQFATYDQGWIGWFVAKAIEQAKNKGVEPFTISGNGKQVRDILHADDMVSLYYQAANNIDNVCGQAFNIGGTFQQSLSLLELFKILEDELKINLRYKQLPPRYSDQKVFIADTAKIEKAINWKPLITARKGIKAMINWVREEKLC